MSRRVFHNLKPCSSIPTPSKPAHRLLHHTASRSVALAAQVPTTADTPGSGVLEPHTSKSAWEVVRDQKRDDLLSMLARDNASPNHVWGTYQGLLNVVGFDHLPLETHQEVLRRCTPNTHALRVSSAQKLWDKGKSRAPHMHEERFQAVVRNMRASGQTPTLDDFHFILDQFAAVGHHTGSLRVLQEARRLGLDPTARTYALVLQALAHRLTLPVLPETREGLQRHVSRMCVQLLHEMRATDIPVASSCMDLAIRIVRDTADPATFDQLLKSAYGIDLEYPDRPPLEYSLKKTAADPVDPSSSTSAPVHFTPSALNTTIDTLGRAGRISKLVQAFEVLTAPLPSPPTQSSPSSFEDEEDEFGFTHAAQTQPYRAPHAEPNTTTYNLLIRHVSQAGNATLARHYAYQAMEADRLADRRLRNDIYNNVPLKDIVPPRVAVNRGTFIPVFGLANQTKDVQLMRWVLRSANRVMRRKTVHLKHYTEWVTQLQEQGLYPAYSLPDVKPWAVPDTPLAKSSRPARTSTSPPSTREAAPHLASTGVTDTWAGFESDSKIDAETNDETKSEKIKEPVKIDLSVFSVDLNAPAPGPSTPKPINIALHLSILRRDISEISRFTAHVEDVLGRTIQRVKERIGRRVWDGKDVYIATEAARIPLSRETWTEHAGWQPRGLAGKDLWRQLWIQSRKSTRKTSVYAEEPPSDTSLTNSESSSTPSPTDSLTPVLAVA
jgi:hypothetical protein